MRSSFGPFAVCLHASQNFQFYSLISITDWTACLSLHPFCIFLPLFQVDGRFLDIEGAKPLQTFIDFCNEGDFHFLVLGPKTSVVGGGDAPPLGSFSAACLQRVTLNTIVSQLPASSTPK